jgi:hypothetical protein
MPLLTDKSVVLIASGATTGDVTISWNFSPLEIKLEERRYSVGSTAVFQQRPIPPTELSVGAYVQTLAPGDIYEVRAFDRNFSTGSQNTDAEKARFMLDEVVVRALGLPSTLESDFNERVGGTFYRYSSATGSTLTHGFMEVGRDAPTPPDAAGFRTMPNPIVTVTSFAPATLHNLTTDKVLFDMPSEDRIKLTDARFALIRLSDSAGRWQQIVREFRTLRRRLTIDFHTIDVQSLGEAPSETEAEMRFKLEAWDRPGPTWEIVQAFEFEHHTVTLSPFNVRDFVMNPVVVIGPRPVGKEVAGLAVHVQEFDPAPFEDEHASSMVFGKPRMIAVKPGEDNEDKPINMVLRAAQEYDPFDTEQEVIVEVGVTVTVAHVP